AVQQGGDDSPVEESGTVVVFRPGQERRADDHVVLVATQPQPLGVGRSTAEARQRRIVGLLNAVLVHVRGHGVIIPNPTAAPGPGWEYVRRGTGRPSHGR